MGKEALLKAVFLKATLLKTTLFNTRSLTATLSWMPLALTGVILLLTACAPGIDPDPDPDEEGGVIGTGIILRGTISDTRQLASAEITIRASTGETTLLRVDSNGRFNANSIAGSAPYLLRADFGNNDYRYSISFADSVTNIHSYSDAIIRSWFAQNNLDIDAEFELANSLENLPGQAEFNSLAEQLFLLVELVLESYNLDGEQLLYSAFNANDTGVDIFLDNNPVLINDSFLSIIITDPESNLQSTRQTQLQLNDTLPLIDFTPPSEPLAVKALGSASNELVVVWEPSTDNVSVAGYQVFRDNELVATTPYPVYIDVGLNMQQAYFFEVVAFDINGNLSRPSEPVSATTLTAVDETPPPAPEQPVLTPDISRVELLWGQSNIADVVAFRVYRGVDTLLLRPLVETTSTFTTDFTVAAGTEYCYQITAIDASENESEFSDVQCTTTSGVLLGSRAEAGSTDDTMPIIPTLSDLQIPDTVNMVCESKLENTSVISNTLLDAPCYDVIGNMQVVEPANLTVAAGTVLRFSSGTRLTVSQGASMTAVGTKDSPIVFTGIDPTPGFWGGIRYFESNSSRNQLQSVVIEYAGGGASSVGLELNGRNGTVGIELVDSLVRNNLGVGVEFVGSLQSIRRFEGNVITGNASPLSAQIMAFLSLSENNDFSGNVEDFIRFADFGNVREDVALPGFNVPYLISSLAANNLTIMPGATIIVDGTAGSIDVFGFFTSKGTRNRNIVVESKTELPGTWVGLFLRAGGVVEYTSVLNAGAASSINSGANITLIGGSFGISDSVISGSAGFGIDVRNAVSSLRFNNNTLRSNIKPLRANLRLLGGLGNDSLYSENEQNLISVRAETNVETTVAIRDFGLPYEFEQSYIVENTILTISEGAELRFKQGDELVLSANSVLNAKGTEDSRIQFVGLDPSATWQGVRITDLSGDLHQLNYVDIVNVGNINSDLDAAINMSCSSQKTLFARNLFISNSGGSGINISPSNCVLDIDESVIFSNIAGNDISMN